MRKSTPQSVKETMDNQIEETPISHDICRQRARFIRESGQTWNGPFFDSKAHSAHYR